MGPAFFMSILDDGACKGYVTTVCGVCMMLLMYGKVCIKTGRSWMLPIREDWDVHFNSRLVLLQKNRPLGPRLRLEGPTWACYVTLELDGPYEPHLHLPSHT